MFPVREGDYCNSVPLLRVVVTYMEVDGEKDKDMNFYFGIPQIVVAEVDLKKWITSTRVKNQGYFGFRDADRKVMDGHLLQFKWDMAIDYISPPASIYLFLTYGYDEELRLPR